MSDIWAEKPIRHSSETELKFRRRRYSWEYQLKIEYDELKEKAEKWDKHLHSEVAHALGLGEDPKIEAIKTVLTKRHANLGHLREEIEKILEVS